MVDVRVFTVKFFKLFCTFVVFHDELLEEKALVLYMWASLKYFVISFSSCKYSSRLSALNQRSVHTLIMA